jgi:antitoxin (DNA-binding transcriptional repressor) of toxin-antitoxin stability system
MTTITATDLRSNLYRLLDQVIATGEPLIIQRGDRAVELRAAAPPTRARLDGLVGHHNLGLRQDDPQPPAWDEAAWAAKWDAKGFPAP